MRNLLNEINTQQREAVESTEGPLLVVAGAGTGKTRVLTFRIAYLILERQVLPENILAITFTNKATKEMEHRIENKVGKKSEEIWISTFHSLCIKILKSHCVLLGYDFNFELLDESGAKSVLKKVMERLEIDSRKIPVEYFLTQIKEAKNSLQSPKNIREDNMVSEVYRDYQKKLKENNYMDFDDLIMLTIRLFEEFPKVLAIYQEKFKYIHIDEYQDTNFAQYKLIKLMAAEHGNICVVGDADQTIYSWRGANVNNILAFEKDYPNAKTVVLDRNYRSKENILQVANSLIRNNQKRLHKNLWSENGNGEKVTLHYASNSVGEIEFILDQIKQLQKMGYSYNDFAILYRSNKKAPLFEDYLLREKIPYKILGGDNFYQRKEIQIVIYYLRLITNFEDDFAFEKIVNTPKRGIGAKTLEKLFLFSQRQEISLMESIQQENQALKNLPLSRLIEFKQIIEKLRNEMEEYNLLTFIKLVLERSGYQEFLKEEDSLESKNRLNNLNRLLIMAARFEQAELTKILIEEGRTETIYDLTTRVKLVLFLNELFLRIDGGFQDEKDASEITLMTMHASKGLEFPIVFVVGMEDGAFPGYHAAHGEGDELEEERRLAYVAITRAQERLYFTASQYYFKNGQYFSTTLSRFIKEIDEQYLSIV